MRRASSLHSLSENGQSSDSASSQTSSGYVKIGMEGVEEMANSASQDPSRNVTPQDLNTDYGMHVKDMEDFAFVRTRHSSPDLQSLTGAMGSWNSDAVPSSREKWQIPGSSYLHQKGFGWLMEVDEVDDMDNRPLLEELDIDLKDIYYKVRCILLPFPFLGYKRQLVRDSPDFWGPLFVVLLFALVSLYGQFRVVSWIITMWIFGSLLIFLLARVLGGEVSYSQCLGVVGYAVLPLVITATVLPLVSTYYYISLLVKFLGVAWATYTAGSLLCVQELQNKRPLLLYPIFLLYVYFLSMYSGV